MTRDCSDLNVGEAQLSKFLDHFSVLIETGSHPERTFEFKPHDLDMAWLATQTGEIRKPCGSKKFNEHHAKVMSGLRIKAGKD